MVTTVNNNKKNKAETRCVSGGGVRMLVMKLKRWSGKASQQSDISAKPENEVREASPAAFQRKSLPREGAASLQAGGRARPACCSIRERRARRAENEPGWAVPHVLSGQRARGALRPVCGPLWGPWLRISVRWGILGRSGAERWHARTEVFTLVRASSRPEGARQKQRRCSHPYGTVRTSFFKTLNWFYAAKERGTE